MELALLAAGGLGLGAYAYWRPTELFNRAVYARLYASGIVPRRLRLPQARVRCWMGGRGEPLVMVHGFGTEAAVNWHGQLPAMRRHFRVIAPDLPGFGASEKFPGDHSIALQVASLRELLDELGIERARVMGHSMGGWISLAFAATFPERVERLVLVDAAGLRFEPDMALERVLLPECVDDAARLIAANFQRPPRLPAFVLRDIVRRCRREAHRRAILHGLVYGDQFVDHQLASVTAPTLLVWGRNDVVTPLAVGERLASTLARAELVVFDDCAHSPNVEQPRRFNQAVLEFLSRPAASLPTAIFAA